MIEWNAERVKEFFSYTRERQEIWYKRSVLKLPPPWTDDQILMAYSFCNNYRFLDRGTAYAINNLLTLEKPEDRVFTVIFYRLFNNPETMDYLGVDNLVNWNHDRILKVLLDRFNRKEKIWRAAYMLAGPQGADLKPGSKIAEYCRVLDGISERRGVITSNLVAAASMQQAWEIAQQEKWLGPFVAYQIILDLDYDRYFHWPADEWVYPGPGAKRGINSMVEAPLKGNDEYIAAINLLTGLQDAYLGKGFKYPLGPDQQPIKLSPHDIEFICCENQKYYRIGQGGKKTRKFVYHD